MHIGKNNISAMNTTNYIMSFSMSTSDQKLYTESWHSPLSFNVWLGGIDSRFKRHLDNKSKERSHSQRVCEPKCRRAKTVDKDILITYRFSVRKVWQPIITSELPQEQENRNDSARSLFHKFLTNVMWTKRLSKTVSWIDHIILFNNFCYH